MATIVVKVAEVKKDKRERPFVHGQDVDTNQYFTVYARKDMPSLLTSKLNGKEVAFSGTIHLMGSDVENANFKLVATSAEIQ